MTLDMTLDEALLARVFWYSLLATAVVAALMSAVGKGMRKSGGPGIVPYELAESVREVERIVRTWGAEGVSAAKRSLCVDMLLLLAYGSTLGTAGLYIATRGDRVGAADWLVASGWTACLLAVLAAVLDLVENVTLLLQLYGRISPRSVRVARWAAQIKFGAVGVAMCVVFTGFGLLQLAP